MDYKGFIEREDVDVARQSNQNFNEDDSYDAVDSNSDGEVRGGQAQAESLQTSPDNVLPNPGVSRDDEEYFMGNQERGVALIFNHETFLVRQHADGPRKPSDRTGSTVDRDALCGAFGSLGFEVLCFDNLCYNEIRSELEKVAAQDHSNRDCIAVAVLSHGNKNGLLQAKDDEYSVSDLWERFTARRCPPLAGKPKLFFIQACRGQGADRGVTVSGVATDAPDDGREEEHTYPVPSYADILVSYSTFEGQYAFRNEEKGSWYVLTLCSQLQAHGRTKDLVSLLTDVNRIIGQSFCSNNKNPKLHGMIQASCFTSSLTRRLCFGQSDQTDRQCSSPNSSYREARIDAENVDDN